MNRNKSIHKKSLKRKSRASLFAATILIVILGVILDQYTKQLAISYLKGARPFVIWDGVFELHYLENRGAAFGILQGKQAFFIISVAVITVLVFWFLQTVPMEPRFVPLELIVSFILAGAYGNCIDRIMLGYVVDFFYFKLIDFPIFNVADIYVTVSAILLIILISFYYKEEDLEKLFHRKKRM